MLRRALGLGAVGGLAFWAANFAVSLTPIAAQYRSALSISYAPMILESLLGGLVIGCGVGYVLLRLFDRIPTATPIPKAVILSLLAFVVIEGFSVLLSLGTSPIYLLIGAGLNLPRFLALALAVGCLYDRMVERVPGGSRVRVPASGS